MAVRVHQMPAGGQTDARHLTHQRTARIVAGVLVSFLAPGPWVRDRFLIASSGADLGAGLRAFCSGVDPSSSDQLQQVGELARVSFGRFPDFLRDCSSVRE